MADKNDFASAAIEATRKWAAEELAAARDRATRLREGGEAYNQAIQAVDQLNWFLRYADEHLPQPIPEEPKSSAPPVTEPEVSKPEPEPEKPARAVDIAEVRTKAKAARDAGVKLADVWAEFGGTKLSEVPHEKYGDVLDLLEAKLKELG